MITEVCNECGQSVKWGTGLFVNRVPDLNDKKTRIQMGKAGRKRVKVEPRNL